MARRVGNRGEKALAYWASQADITMSPPDEDLHGWDYLLEFPTQDSIDPDKSIPLDKVSAPLKCWVQVKSSDGQRGRKSVQLSNWYELVRNPYPTFFLMCEFDGMKTCQRAYLVHVWESYIQRVQKKLRELGPEEQNNLHKYTIDFTYNEDDALSSLDGEGLVAAIRRHVPAGLESYTAAKHELIETVGYEENSQITMTVKLPDGETDPLEYLGDFVIGLVPHLETESIEFKDIRFGIEAPEAAEVLSQGQLTIVDLEAHTTDATIRFFTSDGIDEVRVKVKVFSPKALGLDLAYRYGKLRLESPFVTMMSNFGKKAGNIKFTLPDSDECHPLADLQNVAKCILLMRAALERKVELNFDLEFEGGVIDGGAVTINPIFRKKEYFVSAARAIEHAWQIAKRFDIHQEVVTCIDELLPQLSVLDPVDRALHRIPSLYTMVCQLDSFEPTENNERQLACTPIVLDARMGKFIVVAAYAVVGDFYVYSSLADGQQYLEVVTDNVESIEQRLLRNKENFRNVQRSQYKRLIEVYKDSAHLVFRPDVATWIDEIME